MCMYLHSCVQSDSNSHKHLQVYDATDLTLVQLAPAIPAMQHDVNTETNTYRIFVEEIYTDAMFAASRTPPPPPVSMQVPSQDCPLYTRSLADGSNSFVEQFSSIPPSVTAMVFALRSNQHKFTTNRELYEMGGGPTGIKDFMVQMGSVSLPQPAGSYNFEERLAARAYADYCSFIGGDHKDAVGAMSYSEWCQSPLNTADGVCCAEGPLDEKTDSGGPPGPVNFRSAMCCGPIFRPKPYHFPTPPTQPVISHETGNFNTFPHIEKALALYNNTNGVKPWWLIPTRDKLQANGLLEESERWATRSDRLYVSNWKMLTEALRKSRYVSGYEWWLLQDYYGVGDGILDTHFQPKVTGAELLQFASMNAPVVLLAAQPEDDLPIPDASPRFQTFGYVTNDTLSTSIHVSNYGLAAIEGATLTWEVLGTNSKENITICSHTMTVKHVAQGPPAAWVAKISCVLPDRGTTQPEPQPPLALALRVQLRGLDGGLIVGNSWRSRLFPMFQAGPAPVQHGAFLFTSASLCNTLPFTDMICGIPAPPPAAGGKAMPPGSVIVVTELDATTMHHAANGAAILLLNSSMSMFETATTGFVSNWWIGQWSAASAKSSGVTPGAINNAGTVVERWPEVFEGMAPEGWCDETWFRLINDAQVFKLDGVPNSTAEVIVRATEMPVDWSAWPQGKPAASNNAFVWAAGVAPSQHEDEAGASSSGGVLVASGPNLLVQPFPCSKKVDFLCPPARVPVPEAAWLLFAMVRAAAQTPPKPSAKIKMVTQECPAASCRRRGTCARPECRHSSECEPGCFVSVF